MNPQCSLAPGERLIVQPGMLVRMLSGAANARIVPYAGERTTGAGLHVAELSTEEVCIAMALQGAVRVELFALADCTLRLHTSAHDEDLSFSPAWITAVEAIGAW